MGKQKFLEYMQKYEANISIGGSTLRNQGAPGVIEAARKFLGKLDLSELKKIRPSEYPDILDKWTCNLINELPKKANKWGTARKAINVFMIQVFMNKYLSEEYGLEKLKDVLETPLDSYADKGLRKWVEKLNSKMEIPKWEGIKNLESEQSKEYQECASYVAEKNGLSRACLDTILWRAKK
jgi:hypothetical protein